MASPVAYKPQQNVDIEIAAAKATASAAAAVRTSTTEGNTIAIGDNQTSIKPSAQQQQRILQQQLAQPHLGGIINFYG
jgi:hypothetical protein